MPNRFFLLAAACAGLFHDTPVLALSSSANAQGSQFSYELIDLDLTDQITPAINFTARMEAFSSYYDFIQPMALQRIDAFGTTSTTRAAGEASASIGADGTSAHAVLPTPGLQREQFSAWTRWNWDIELTPATAVIFRAVATLDATPGGDGLFASSTVTMFGRLETWNPTVQTLSAFNDYVSSSQTQGGQELFGYMHTGSESRRGFVSIEASATVAVLETSPVPEPSSCAMLLAGLGLLGWRHRHVLGLA